MEIRASLLPSLESVQEDVDVAIVIDVLRATSAITTALASGASRVFTVPTIEQAFSLQNQRSVNSDLPALLCGERQCQPIDGFDLGNSPAEYTPAKVRGRELIFSTTNGTRAIESAKPAGQVWLGSFLNRSAIVSALSNSSGDQGGDVNVVHLVCSGTDGHITREDVLLAGNLIHGMNCDCDWRLANDQARIAKDAFGVAVGKTNGDMEMSNQSAMAAEFHDCLGGRNLVAKGYSADLNRCAAMDTIMQIPRRESGDGIACFV